MGTARTFDQLPDSAFVRAFELVPTPGRREVLAPLPFSESTLWRKVREGTFPKPVRLSAGVTCWEAGSVREWIKAQSR